MDFIVFAVLTGVVLLILVLGFCSYFGARDVERYCDDMQEEFDRNRTR